LPPVYPPPAAPPGYYPQAYPPQPYQPPAFTPYPQARSPLQWRAYVRAKLDAGQPVAPLLAEMASSGVTQQDAFGLVTGALDSMRKRALAFLLGGGIAVLVGIGVTLSTQSAAMDTAESTGTGMYVVWIGPVLCGIIAAAYGLYLLSRVPKLNS
jgi:hypothetical protein